MYLQLKKNLTQTQKSKVKDQTQRPFSILQQQSHR